MKLIRRNALREHSRYVLSLARIIANDIDNTEKRHYEKELRLLLLDLKKGLSVRLGIRRESHYEYLRFIILRIREYRLALELAKRIRIRALKERLVKKYKGA